MYEDAKNAVGNAAEAAKQTLGAAAQEVKGTAQDAAQRAQTEGASAQSTVQSKADKAYNEAKVMMGVCEGVWHACWGAMCTGPGRRRRCTCRRRLLRDAFARAPQLCDSAQASPDPVCHHPRLNACTRVHPTPVQPRLTHFRAPLRK